MTATNSQEIISDANASATVTSAIISDLFSKVKDSVIEIVTVSNVINPKITIDDAPLAYGGGTSGSGFVYDINGNIVTNYHVTQGADVIYVRFASGNSYPATIIGEDPYSDLAIIQVDSSALFRENLKPLRIENSSDVQVGQQVFAIGSPRGLTLSVSEGIISQINRIDLNIITGRFWTGGLIQTDAAINPGNSGGPLLDLDGDVVGVNEYGLVDIATGASEQGLNFAIGPATIQRVIPKLISQSTYEYPWLGIEIADVTPLFADSLGLSEAKGVFIKSVTPESPAEKAGIAPFSIIFSVDGNVVKDKSELIDYMENNKLPGDEISLNIITPDGKRTDITSVLEQREAFF
ncbi:MAG TPA: trypsin-like peptidase domain-containing protein [Nitrososphaeraceae archaeon]|nr:trypsin-like peptidase domain-containing protein [Nitrososphaeraceae archaeon]